MGFRALWVWGFMGSSHWGLIVPRAFLCIKCYRECGFRFLGIRVPKIKAYGCMVALIMMDNKPATIIIRIVCDTGLKIMPKYDHLAKINDTAALSFIDCM